MNRGKPKAGQEEERHAPVWQMVEVVPFHMGVLQSVAVA
jgi:hypothetical protein